MEVTVIDGCEKLFDFTAKVARQAIIAPFNRKVLLRSSPASDMHSLGYMSLLRSGLVNKWFAARCTPEGRLAYDIKNKPSRLLIPEIHLTGSLNISRLQQHHTSSVENSLGMLSTQSALAYVLIVQGADAATTQRILLCYSQREAGEAVMLEALNGHSVVFGALILSKAAEMILALSQYDPKNKMKSMQFYRVPLNANEDAVGDRSFEYDALRVLTNLHGDVNGHISIGYTL